ncbi:hypothetical protein [Alkalicoccus urumqiensis]|uniref:Uncharacterized protein n=1 Tax=Alkalicoccus urumqiensis TaxID=1548213 RepID=A0A2P6MDU0_ALKUR|nr:hypothetical protein [Alkalicoccus urumqiensis]PRO64449.1 hypothetical protein C6I21_14715 [Alkalicoccus urumqiensis]
MAFGVTRKEIYRWRREAESGTVAFLTHFWLDDRFPECITVTKAACTSRDKLIHWGKEYGLRPEWIHEDGNIPHFDLLGEKEEAVLLAEGCAEKLYELRERSRRSNRKDEPHA